MRKTELWATLLIFVLGAGAVLLAGARSAAGRLLDVVEYRTHSPYYQAAALRAQVAGDDGSGMPWVFVALGTVVLAVVALVSLRPLMREFRLLRRRQYRARRATTARPVLPTLPSLPQLPGPQRPSAGDERAPKR